MKLLFLVRKAYNKMLQRKVRRQPPCCYCPLLTSPALSLQLQVQHDQKLCDQLEGNFHTIRQATGLSDVKEIVKKFVNRHATFTQLQRQSQMTRDRIDSQKAENARLRAALDDAEVSRGPVNEQRDTYMRLEDFERKLQEVRWALGDE